MRVLFVLDSAYPVTNAGAVRVHSFAQAFSPASAEILGGVTGKLPAITQGRHFVPRRNAQKGVAFLLSWVSFLIRLHTRLFRVVRKINFDAVVISVPRYELLWSVPLIRRYCSVVVIDVRDSPGFVDYPSHFNQFLPRFFAYPLGKATSLLVSRALARQLQFADLITVANDGIQQKLSNWNPKIRLVLNGVDTSRFIAPCQPRSSIRLQIVYMGNFAPKDQFGWIYEALPVLTGPVCLNLIGDGRQKLKVCTRLRELRIKYVDHGIVEHLNVPKLLECMHVGVLFRDTYAEDSIPVAFFEFASMNIPVICNNVGITGRFVSRYGIGYVIESSGELVNILSKFVEYPEELAKYSHLHDIAEREFSRVKQARELLRHLRRVLDAKSQTAA